MDISKYDYKSFSPMMKQYIELKKQYQDAIMFTRIGDFYEMFFEDAILASKELELALTGKDCGQKERVPMCGIPFHAYEPYATKLVERGYKVVIVEQMEDPKEVTKGIVKRDVIKIITPGTLNLRGSDSKENNYLACLRTVDRNFILAYTDIATGDSYLTDFSNFENALNELIGLKAKEVIINTNLYPKYRIILQRDYSVMVSFEDDLTINESYKEVLNTLEKEAERETFAMLLNYVKNTQRMELPHIKQVVRYEKENYLKIDAFSKRNLELTETLRNGAKNGSLLWLLDKCQTAMGSRLLHRFLDRPLMDIKSINYRLDFVSAFKDNYLVRESIKELLSNVYDLERIVGRIASNQANAKDLVWLRRSLRTIAPIKEELRKLNLDIAFELVDSFDDLSSLLNVLEASLVDNPPLSIKEGGMIAEGFNETLDEIKGVLTHNQDWLIEYERLEKERTGLKNLKVGYNRVFGYYIEVSKGQAKEFTDLGTYERKQTLANAERYISPELKEHETLLLGANEKICSLEYDLFLELRETALKEVHKIQNVANIFSLIDVFISLANVAIKANYVRPVRTEKREVNIINGRHPVIESFLDKTYVENDVVINDYNMIIITGPNMSGKSTYMRELALIAIMAQMGSFVPAKSALLCLFDAIFTRIGASDDLVSGQSTFMVEMMEANYALQNATKNSLILFDEIGRGTATYDGMALAQAIIEYVHEKIGCITLFSTHYHELVELEHTLKHLKNVHVSAKEGENKVVFLHKVLDGPTDKSYGINVAELAHLPKSLIKRSKEILTALEETKGSVNIDLNLFNFEEPEEEVKASKNEEIIDDLRILDLNSMTPLDCMTVLSTWQKKVK